MGKKIIGEDGNEYILKEVKPFYKKWWFWLLVIVLILSLGEGRRETERNRLEKEKSTPVVSRTTTTSSEVDTEIKRGLSKAERENTQSSVEKTEVVESNKTPREYISALESAMSYSEMMHMSKAGIYDQLTSQYGDKFSDEAAQYAVDNLKVDYKSNALESAKNYQDTMSMSAEGIRDQLTSQYGEKFTQEEADYAIEHLPK